MADASEVFTLALDLSDVERIELAERLIESVGEGADSDSRLEAWVREVDRRRTELKSGAATADDWRDVSVRVRAALDET